MSAFLVALLNSTPVVAGVPTDELDADWIAAHRPGATVDDWPLLREARTLLQSVVRGALPAEALTPLLAGVHSRPSASADGVTWTVDATGSRALVVDAVLAWSGLHRDQPGRLRACANDECARFLLDASRANNARWCSMALCGNKLKARRHYRRTRAAD
ncbi:CGNR zinc finger domain-containing protein [Catenuloplanes japonicus]|uniref:CGNR zinc finger domain-containing protein n=1 Tax=Catenuloplanes japonicus TaxID=33876 RepID=UPI000526B07D|nr:CGNR zinc finger domain-containing protein [Catenuloplanes japonicus]